MTDLAQWPAGFMVAECAQGPSQEWVTRFAGIPTSWVGDALGRNIGTVGLRRYHDDVDRMVVGRAVTVRLRPGDNLMLHKALELAQEGDVIVVDAGGDLSQAVIGGNIMLTAEFKGVAGFVVDGAIRDLGDWAGGRVPIWAKGHTHRGPSKDGPGEVNVTVTAAGLVVSPGDLVVCDADGVVAIPTGRLDAVWPAIESQRARELKMQAENAKRLPDPERINALLREKGCPV